MKGSNVMSQIQGIDIKEFTEKLKNKEIEELKNKYNISVDDYQLARKIKKLIQADEFQDIYEYSEDSRITGFYSKKMLDKVLDNFIIINPTGDENSNFLYQNGVYQKNNELKTFIFNRLNTRDKNITRNLNETLKVIAIAKKIEPDLINSDDNIINFKNGLYVINQNKIIPHDPNIISTIQIQTNYTEFRNTKFENSLFFKYLNTSFSVEVIPVIQEIFGYCLSSFTEAQKMFVLLGDGSNGKSVFISILNSFFKNEFISCIDLINMDKPEYIAKLYNKSINTCADISNKYMENTGLLKQLLGEDLFTARSLYSNPFEFKNRAKMIFSANELPQTNDKTFAFIRRLKIIKCNKRITEENKIKNLAEKIINIEKELIASWAIEGLQRLIKQNFVFTKCKETDDAIEEYKLHNNSVQSFITEFCNINPNDNIFIPKTEFIEMYKRYCLTENTKPLGAKNINKTMTDNGIYEKHSTLYKGRYWKGISWNTLIYELSVKDGYRFCNTPKDIEKEYKIIEREGIKTDK
jgi:putative DNA primase/helicase